VFDQALEQPAAERLSFVDTICAGDEDLRAAVHRLLAATAAASSILDSPLTDHVAPLAAFMQRRPRPQPGLRFGAYELIRELGQGGMATVYLARDHKHDRDVALKVLHPELAAMVGAERFLQEIRVTARLGHPHIITLIESGETDVFLWYVIPSIKGASLRDRLEQKKRLDIEEALVVARQIGGALDYAHRQGVIHRDIKPENILLHEGEAMLADFGIALAVHEAAGSSPGIPIGTPRYMSPEQAKGEAVDARSDVFSFGAVVYEMLAGTAPHAAATSREVIERILGDPPLLLRSMRKGIPTWVEAAVAKALAKDPNERFASPRDFLQALDASPVRKRRRILVAAFVIAGLTLVAGMLPALKGPPHATPIVRDRTQLTSTGEAVSPAISADGAEVAYVVRQCDTQSCSYAVESLLLNSGARRILTSGWSAVYRISWSWNRRNLIIDGTLDRRHGAHLISTSGEVAPRLLIGGPQTGATFVPGADSILIANRVNADGTAWLQLVSLRGDSGDRIPVEKPGNGLHSAQILPGKRWLVVAVNVPGRTEWRILDRRGRQEDVMSFQPGSTPWLSGRTSSDALWLLLAGSPALERRLVRVGIDARYGRFEGSPDTVLLVKEETFDVTEDGKTIIYNAGTYRYDVWGLGIDEALRGEFSASRRLGSSTSFVYSLISPDGRNVMIAGPQHSAFLVAFEGGTPKSLGSSETVEYLGWMPDTSLLWYADRTIRGFTMMLADPQTKTRRHAGTVHASGMREPVPLMGGGWVWLASGGGVIQALLPGDARPRELQKPPEMRLILHLASATDRQGLLMTGWNTSGDSLLLYEISFPGGEITRLTAFFGESENAMWLADGSILVAVQESLGMATLYRVKGRNLVERVGAVSRRIGARGRVTASADGRRLGIVTHQYDGDIWLAKVGLTR